jgi:hypothetical protein
MVKKIDLEDVDPMYAVFRNNTEQYRSRMSLVHIRGEANLADHWSRHFPWAPKVIQQVDDVNVVVPFVSSDGEPVATTHDKKEEVSLETLDFKPDESDESDLKLPPRYGVPIEKSDDVVRVFLKNS